MSLPSNTDTKRVPRDTFREKHFQPYAKAIGQVVLAWNDLHESIGYLFACILGEDAYDMAGEVWYTCNQDRAARQMLRAAASKFYTEPAQNLAKAKDDIAFLLAQVESLEDARNDIVHSPMWLVGIKNPAGPEIRPVHIFGHRRAVKLSKKPNLLAEMAWCRETAIALRDFTIELDDAIWNHRRLKSWPKRPSLPNRGQKKSRPTPPRPLLPK